MLPKLTHSLPLLLACLVSYCSAFCKEGLPCIFPDKGHYQTTDQWIDLKCAKWSAEQRVQFLIDTGAAGNAVMFDSSLADPVTAQYKNKIKVNLARNGISYGVANNKQGTPKIYCKVEDKLSPPVQLNYITSPTIQASSASFKPDTDLTLTCNFDLKPRNNFLLSVEYYAGSELLASIRQGEGYFGSAGTTNVNIPDRVSGLKASYTPNKSLALTVRQIGQFGKSRFHCMVKNIYVFGNDYQSESVQIDGFKASSNSAESAFLSLFSTAVSLALVALQLW